MAETKIEFHQHPVFLGREDALETYRDLYDNHHARLTNPKYLWMHELEYSQAPVTQTVEGVAVPVGETVGSKLRRIRAQRSRNLNIFEVCVSTWITMAFEDPAVLDGTAEELLKDGNAKDDIDGKGTSLDAFIKKVALRYFRDVQPFILVDAPENTAASLGQEQANGFRPFMEILETLDVKDWQENERTPSYDWVRFEFKAIEPRTSSKQKPEESLYTKEYAKADGSVVLDVFRQKDGDWKPVGARALQGFTEIPVATVFEKDDWCEDIADTQLVLFNKLSAYYSQLDSQAFRNLFIATDSTAPAKLSISEYSVNFLPADAKVIAVEPASTEALESVIDRLVDMIFRQAFNRVRGLAADSKEAPSENTLREMAKELIILLKQAIEDVEGMMNDALRFYAMFKLGPEKGSKFEGKISLPKDLDVGKVAEQLEVALAYKDDIRKVLSWYKAELKRVARERGYTPEELVDIEKEIDALKKEDPALMDPLRGFGRFGQNPKDPGAVKEDGPEEEDPKTDQPASGANGGEG